MLSTGYQYKGTAAVRYPRGGGAGAHSTHSLETLPIGKGNVIRASSLTHHGNHTHHENYGKKVAILAFGSMVTPSLAAANNTDATLVNMRFIKPLDSDLIEKIAKTHDLIVTVEENSLMGGAGSAVMEAMQSLNISTPTMCLGLPDTFIEHGVHETMLAQCGLDEEGITAAIKSKLSSI